MPCNVRIRATTNGRHCVHTVNCAWLAFCTDRMQLHTFYCDKKKDIVRRYVYTAAAATTALTTKANWTSKPMSKWLPCVHFSTSELTFSHTDFAPTMTMSTTNELPNFFRCTSCSVEWAHFQHMSKFLFGLQTSKNGVTNFPFENCFQVDFFRKFSLFSACLHACDCVSVVRKCRISFCIQPEFEFANSWQKIYNLHDICLSFQPFSPLEFFN